MLRHDVLQPPLLLGSSTAEVYEHVGAPALDNTLAGFNGTIFALDPFPKPILDSTQIGKTTYSRSI